MDSYYLKYMATQLEPLVGLIVKTLIVDEYGYVGLEFDNGYQVYFESDGEGNSQGYVRLFKGDEDAS